jgi:hypothetical protein
MTPAFAICLIRYTERMNECHIGAVDCGTERTVPVLHNPDYEEKNSQGSVGSMLQAWSLELE